MDRDARIDALFNDALELTASKRGPFLAEACGDDEKLLRDVSRLLQAHDELGSFLVPPAPAEARIEDAATVAARPDEVPTVAPGHVLGERYRVEAALGTGGMGEVWRALDLKLRVEVALKWVRPDVLATDQGRELLRQEVRAARKVVSPNVCRIFDLEVEDGQEFVSMEYIDGHTLQSVLREKAPLGLREAGEIAAQLLAGLEAIHEAGLVHRDLKCENVMLTRAGRVVVMDFGLAKVVADGLHTIAGTPAYMAPEQLRGDRIDARADVFSVGVMLSEMISPARGLEERKDLWRGLRETPPRVPESPWAPVIRKAVAWYPDDRYPSARALSRALEEVTLRAEGVEDRTPYPGLSSFTESDAEFFFGREAEVESLAKRIQRLPFLAVIGPSGVGKSSFLRAGLLPVLPEDWSYAFCKPGSAPFTAFGHALAPEVAGDAEAVAQLLHLEDPGVAVDLARRWRRKHTHALLVVDQFEELFTLNPAPVQAAFAELLGRILLEADVHVLLSLRDDFLFRCHEFESLAPVFSELTPLGSLSGPSLRRALVQPALACGYRFEDESLVDEMVKEVQQERGALPLLAFTAARMWERRERETGTLTRTAYRELGGVEGALAQHAEATLGRVGAEREPLVREIFRNLVTAQGTRAVREVRELLSVFEDRSEAEAVLRELIDARLLTSFEVPGTGAGDGGPTQRVEIIHESLLSAWPRLVRWQAQDEEGALLRDQLRQAAQLWEQRSRSDDLLWTGTAYREFELWREHYPGGLSDNEEQFARAMERRDARQRSRKRRLLAGVITAMAAVIVVVVTLWQQSRLEARRAEGRNLLRFAEANADENPSAAFAYALASLELADDRQAREFVLRVLQSSPISMRIPGGTAVDPASDLGRTYVAFSPAGEHLAVGLFSGEAEVWRDTGEWLYRLSGNHEPVVDVAFENSTSTIVSGNRQGKFAKLWSITDGSLLNTLTFEDVTLSVLTPRTGGLLTLTSEGTGGRWRSYSPHGDPPQVRGTIPRVPGPWAQFEVDPTATWSLMGEGTSLVLRRLDDLEAVEPVVVGEHEAQIQAACFAPDGRHVAASDRSGRVYLWDRDASSGRPLRILKGADGKIAGRLAFDATGSWLAAAKPGYGAAEGNAWLWHLAGPPGADSAVLGFGGENTGGVFNVVFHPTLPWLATGTNGGVALWSIARPRPYVLRLPGDVAEGAMNDLVFAPDASWILASHSSGVWRWSLDPSLDLPTVELIDGGTTGLEMELSPDGSFVAVTAGGPHVIDLATQQIRVLDGLKSAWSIAVSPDGGLVAAGGGGFSGPEDRLIRVWNLQTGKVRALDAGVEAFGNRTGLFFLSHDELVVTGGPLEHSGIRIWNLAEERYRSIWNESVYRAEPSPDGRVLLCIQWPVGNVVRGPLMVLELETNETRMLPTYGDEVSAVCFAPDGRIVVGSSDGTIRVGDLADGEPHLLLGHEGSVSGLEVSRDGEWIASASFDGTVRIWPMPEGQPLHALPYDELMRELRSVTNLRVVADRESPNGYRLGIDGFDGWKDPSAW